MYPFPIYSSYLMTVLLNLFFFNLASLAFFNAFLRFSVNTYFRFGLGFLPVRHFFRQFFNITIQFFWHSTVYLQTFFSEDNTKNMSQREGFRRLNKLCTSRSQGQDGLKDTVPTIDDMTGSFDKAQVAWPHRKSAHSFFASALNEIVFQPLVPW